MSFISLLSLHIVLLYILLITVSLDGSLLFRVVYSYNLSVQPLLTTPAIFFTGHGASQLPTHITHWHHHCFVFYLHMMVQATTKQSSTLTEFNNFASHNATPRPMGNRYLEHLTRQTRRVRFGSTGFDLTRIAHVHTQFNLVRLICSCIIRGLTCFYLHFLSLIFHNSNKKLTNTLTILLAFECKISHSIHFYVFYKKRR